MTTDRIFGIDVGGVIAPSLFESQSRPLEVLDPIEDALAGMAEIVKRLGAEHVYLVTSAPVHMYQRRDHWLRAHRFYKETGVLPSHFKRCYLGALKGEICNYLRVTNFVDNHLYVLEGLVTVEQRYLFRAQGFDPTYLERLPKSNPRITPVESWRRLLEVAFDRAYAH